jgi:hypothetical protein
LISLFSPFCRLFLRRRANEKAGGPMREITQIASDWYTLVIIYLNALNFEIPLEKRL